MGGDSLAKQLALQIEKSCTVEGQPSRGSSKHSLPGHLPTQDMISERVVNPVVVRTKVLWLQGILASRYEGVD